MNLADPRLKELDNPLLTRDESAALRCRLASEFTHTGRYELTREALGGFWRGIGERPDVEGLTAQAAADVLLQSGVLTGWLGRAQRVTGAQEQAKDLISEALRIFETQGQRVKVSEARYELGMCYFRLGAYDEARIVLDEALNGLTERDADLKAKILIRHTIVEVWTGRYHDAWAILENAREFFEASGDALKGRWHGQRGLVLQRLALTEKRGDYADRAIMEFTGANHYYERSGHERYCANNFNNLAMLLYQIGRYAEAHENLDRAQLIFTILKDPGNVAQVDETRARVLVAEKKYTEANRIVGGVIKTFEAGGDAALLADALIIQGVVWARLGGYQSSVNILNHAVKVARDAGAISNAGLAALTLIEEHGAIRLPDGELFTVYLRADELLRDTQDIEDITRLRACARLIIKRLAGGRLRDKNFSLHGAMHDLEARFIEEALDEARGSVTRAAKLLGIARQSLVVMLNTRHKTLSKKRTAREETKAEHHPEAGRIKRAAQGCDAALSTGWVRRIISST